MHEVGREHIAPLDQLGDWQPAEGEPELRDFEVFDREGNSIGSASDMHVDTDTGEVIFVEVARGGLMGMGAKHTLIPFDLFDVDESNKRLNLMAMKEDLDNAPEFRGDESKDYGRFHDYWQGHSRAWAERREPEAHGRESGETRIAETEEHLEPYKRVEETGRVEAHKEVETETQTVREPVKRTRVRVYRRAITGERDLEPGEEISGEEEVVIPVTEEHLEARKKTEVTGEVVIKPETYAEEETISGEIRKERVEVEEHGDVELEEDEERAHKP